MKTHRKPTSIIEFADNRKWTKQMSIILHEIIINHIFIYENFYLEYEKPKYIGKHEINDKGYHVLYLHIPSVIEDIFIAKKQITQEEVINTMKQILINPLKFINKNNEEEYRQIITSIIQCENNVQIQVDPILWELFKTYYQHKYHIQNNNT